MYHKIKILVADDHALVRRGIVSLLSFRDEFEVIGEAENGRAVVSMAIEKQPDVILMDIGMPVLNGLEATRKIKRECPDTKVLVLSGYDDDKNVNDVIAAGADGFLVKDTQFDDLCSAIESVYKGNVQFHPKFFSSPGKIKKPNCLLEDNGSGQRQVQALTPREREILQLIAEGNSHQKISVALSISIRTVDTHRNNIMQKLDIHDAATLVNYAIRNRIVFLPS